MIKTTQSTYDVGGLIAAAGLYSDEVAGMLYGPALPFRILPFRGEYYSLSEQAASKVKGLVYPVPNPAFPFLGVHFTRHIDGSVAVGPNAVLAMGKESYHWGRWHAREIGQILAYQGFWRLVKRYGKEGLKELQRALFKSLYLRNLRTYAPFLCAKDLIKGKAGVRAQACDKNGYLLDDFLILRQKKAVFIGNAPSPAATACLAIGQYVANMWQEVGR